MTRAARILLVDDEVSQRAVVPLLRSRGYEVETVATGSDALKAVAVHAPDLVVLDLALPDLKGTAVCRRIREEFENGRHYYALHGNKIEPPLDIGQSPDPDALIWHNEHCFR